MIVAKYNHSYALIVVALWCCCSIYQFSAILYNMLVHMHVYECIKNVIALTYSQSRPSGRPFPVPLVPAASQPASQHCAKCSAIGCAIYLFFAYIICRHTLYIRECSAVINTRVAASIVRTNAPRVFFANYIDNLIIE